MRSPTRTRSPTGAEGASGQGLRRADGQVQGRRARAQCQGRQGLRRRRPGRHPDAYAKATEKWQGLSKGIGHDPDKFTEALWREVYLKLDPEKLRRQAASPGAGNGSADAAGAITVNTQRTDIVSRETIQCSAFTLTRGRHTAGRARGAQARHGRCPHIRLRDRRRRLGRLPARQPPLGRPGDTRAAAGGGRPGRLDLVSHPGRLPLLQQQPALGLVLSHRARAWSRRAQHPLSARQGGGPLLGHLRHDLHARPGRRLRSLAPARPRRLGLGRRAAPLQGARGLLRRRRRRARGWAASFASIRPGWHGRCSMRCAARRSTRASPRSTISIAATTKGSDRCTSTSGEACASRRPARSCGRR